MRLVKSITENFLTVIVALNTPPDNSLIEQTVDRVRVCSQNQ